MRTTSRPTPYATFAERDLVDAGASGHVAFDTGGNGFTQVIAANTRQVHDDLIASGISADDLDRFLELLDDPDTVVGNPGPHHGLGATSVTEADGGT